MSPLQELLSFHIIERGKNDKIFMTWTYPTISDSNKQYILNKINQINKINYIYLKNKKEWIYINNTDIFDTNKLTDIKQFSIVIIAKDYSPNKYEMLCKILSKCYSVTGNPVELVKPYLSIYTTGMCCTQENGTFIMKEFENSRNTAIKIKDFINIFGLEVILIYTAMLLKKRIVVYHHTLDILLKSLQSIIILMLHRNPNDFLFPWVEINQAEILELKSKNWFVAGFTDSTICSKTENFDLLINLPALEINVMPHAKESFIMTKTHKDIAISMVQMSENLEISESEVAKEISKKTQELLIHLKSFATVTTENEPMLTLNDLKSKNLHPALENFLFNLAVAENLMMF